MHRFRFFYKEKNRGVKDAPKCCLSLCPLLKVIIAGVIEIKGEGGRAGGDKHEWRKSTNNKHHFEISVLLLSTSFLHQGQREKKPRWRETAPFHLLLRPLQFVADRHEAGEGCGEGGREGGVSLAERGNISKCDADDVGIRSSRCLAAPRQSKHFCLFVCLVDLRRLLRPFKCPQELQSTFSLQQKMSQHACLLRFP